MYVQMAYYDPSKKTAALPGGMTSVTQVTHYETKIKKFAAPTTTNRGFFMVYNRTLLIRSDRGMECECLIF